MMYYSNKARMTARDTIADIHVKIANMPLSAFPGGLADVQAIHGLLEIMDGELRREIKQYEDMRRLYTKESADRA